MLSKEGKRSAIIHGSLFIVWIALLIVASFKDLDISKALSNSDSFVGAFIAVIAEWPAYLIGPIASVILFYNVDNMTRVKAKNITLKVLFALLHYGTWFLFFFASEKLYKDMPHELGFSIGFAVLAGTACLYFARYIDKDFMKTMCKFAVFMVIVLLASRIICTIMKLIWSRARFRDMLAHGTFEEFTPWYKINGYRKIDGYKLTSFPSGHVTSATNLFVIVVLADIFPRLKNKKWILYTVCSVFVALTMIYRVVYNAHFFSDTLIALLVSYLSFYVTKALFFKKGFVYDFARKGDEGIESHTVESEA